MSSSADRFKGVDRKILIKTIIEQEEKEVDLLKRVEALEKLVSSRGLDRIDRILELERDLYRQQQYSRRETVEITNIPESVADGDDLEDKVVELFNFAGVHMERRDFHAIHRLKNKRVVIAKCINRRDAIAILRAKRKLREANEADRKKLGIVNKIYVNESLCFYYRRLFGICNALYKKKLLSSSFTINGTIKVIHEPGGRKMDVTHMEDLVEIVGEEAISEVMEDHNRRMKKD